jgi:hypothetical protein
MIAIRHGWSEETNLELKLDTPGLVLAICLFVFGALLFLVLIKPRSLAKHLIVFHTREVLR